MGRLCTFFKDHWRGNGLFSMVFFNLIGVSVMLRYFIGSGAFAPLWIVVASLALILIWQITGGIRYGERVMRDGAIARVWAVYTAVVVTLIMTASQMMSLILPQPELVLEVTGQTPKTEVRGTDVWIIGDIDYRILTELQSTFKTNKTIKSVTLNSQGGNPIAGRSVGLFIAKHGLNTRVEGECFSACILVFAGGTRRELVQGGALGFHGYRIDSGLRVQTVDMLKVAQKDIAFLIGRGFAEPFVQRIFETPPDDLWRPSRQEMLDAGVLSPASQ